MLLWLPHNNRIYPEVPNLALPWISWCVEGVRHSSRADLNHVVSSLYSGERPTHPQAMTVGAVRFPRGSVSTGPKPTSVRDKTLIRAVMKRCHPLLSP